MNRPGCCCLCEKEVQEIVQKHTKGRMKGEPIRLGKHHDDSWRVSYELSDGSIADITLCESCLGGDFEKIWASVRERFIWEHENIEKDYTPLQKERVEKEIDRILELSIRREIGRRMWKHV